MFLRLVAITFIIAAAMILNVVPLSAQRATTESKSTSENKSAVPALNLHLIYFRIEGTRCPICLVRISNYLRNQEGVEMSELSYHLPIESVLIYDKSKLDVNNLFTLIGKAESVKFVDIEDSTVASLPKFIRPRAHKVESFLNPYITP